MVLKNLNFIYSKIVSIIVILSYLKYNAFIFGYSTTDVNSYFTCLFNKFANYIKIIKQTIFLKAVFSFTIRTHVGVLYNCSVM